MRDEYGLYDGMTPISAIVSEAGLTVAIYLTNPPTRGGRDQEVKRFTNAQAHVRGHYSGACFRRSCWSRKVRTYLLAPTTATISPDGGRAPPAPPKSSPPPAQLPPM